MTLGEKIVKARKNMGISQKELSEKLGISPTRLNYWEKDKRFPPVPMLNRLSEVLQIDGGALIGRNPKESAVAEGMPLSEQELTLLKRFRILDDHGKEAVSGILNIEYQRIEQAAQAAQLSPVSESPPEEDNIIPIPLSWSKASAGEGFYLFEGPDEELKVIYNNYTRKADFCVRVTGHSMEPKI